MDLKQIEKTETIPHFRAPANVLYNTECLFIQYHDIIRCPWFTVLRLIQHNADVLNLVSFDEIDDTDISAQFEWYINRKTRNFLDALPTNPNMPDLTAWKQDILTSISQVIYTTGIVDKTLLLSPTIVLRTLFDEKVVKKVVIWDEMGLDGIDKDIYAIFEGVDNHLFTFWSGPIGDRIKTLPVDTTYFISDIEFINKLIEFEHLSLASIILGDYNYNKRDGELKINIEELIKKYTFKFAEVSTLTVGNHKDGHNPVAIN